MFRYLLIVAIVTMTIGGVIYADDEVHQEVPQKSNPITVDIGLYLLNIENFDVKTGGYIIDFYLSMESDKPMLSTNFEFMNGRSLSIDKVIDEPNNKFFRIRANLAIDLDLHKFPFDRHSLLVKLEDKTITADKQIYRVKSEQSGVDPNVHLFGWDVKSYETNIDLHEYKVYNEVYSQYRFAVNIERSSASSIVKFFLPVGIILIISILAVFVSLDRVIIRLNMMTMSLLTAVFFHTNINASIPGISYLTIADRLMVGTYISIMFNILFSFIATQAWDTKGDEQGERFYIIAQVVVPMATIVGFILCLIL